jgi:hypothetical protein
LFDPGAVGDPTRQQHDWEPGIAASGLFWTIPVTPWTISVVAASGRARMRADHVAVPDFHDFFSAVFGGGPAPIPSRVSFDVRWSGDGGRQKIRDTTFGFEGHYVTGTATISFTARDDRGGVTYISDHSGQHNPTLDEGGAGLPAVGYERNGIFF